MFPFYQRVQTSRRSVHVAVLGAGELVRFSSLRAGRTGAGSAGAGCAPRGWGPHAANPEGPQHPRGRPGRPGPPPSPGATARAAQAQGSSALRERKNLPVARTPDPPGASGRSGERGLCGAWGGDRREAQVPPSGRGCWAQIKAARAGRALERGSPSPRRGRKQD